MKVQFIAGRFGELSVTKSDIIAPLAHETEESFVSTDGFTFSKSAVWRGILNSDDWRPIDGLKYSLVEVDLPEGLDPKWYMSNEVCFKYLWGMSPKSKNLPIDLQIKLISKIPDTINRCIIADLAVTAYGKGFRSAFRKSLWDQAQAWLNSDSPEYSLPLSPRQIEAVAKPIWQYRQAEARIYNSQAY